MDKLLVSLTDFLAYIQTLRDVSFREGEAPADASSSGAIQLMTVHKAKGLEFLLTVLADAAHQTHARATHVQLPFTNHQLLLDLRADDTRHIIDFKTDEVRTDAEARDTIRRAGYDAQVARYARAIESQLKVKVKTRLVFLNVNGEIKIYK